MKTNFLLVVLSLSIFTSCKTNEPVTFKIGHYGQEVMMHGSIEVISIRRESWIDNIGPKALASGDYMLFVKYLSPIEYKNKSTQIPVISKSDLIIDGHEIRTGDILEFDAFETMFTGAQKPYMFNNLKNIKKVNRAGPTIAR